MIKAQTPAMLDGRFTWNSEPIRTSSGPCTGWHAMVGRSPVAGAGHSEAQAIANLVEQLYRATQIATAC